ncbi:hypothetical protein N0V88_005329 [Collariella sp. IMI 366227]|nr:hypothetical protein N0V88_005329 [Collariella sp. IMI 366227]
MASPKDLMPAFVTIRRFWRRMVVPPKPVEKDDGALRFGVLGADPIAEVCFLKPAKLHPDVFVESIAATDKKEAEKLATKYGIRQALGDYQLLIDDDRITALYICVPEHERFE